METYEDLAPAKSSAMLIVGIAVGAVSIIIAGFFIARYMKNKKAKV